MGCAHTTYVLCFQSPRGCKSVVCLVKVRLVSSLGTLLAKAKRNEYGASRSRVWAQIILSHRKLGREMLFPVFFACGRHDTCMGQSNAGRLKIPQTWTGALRCLKSWCRLSLSFSLHMGAATQDGCCSLFVEENLMAWEYNLVLRMHFAMVCLSIIVTSRNSSGQSFHSWNTCCKIFSMHVSSMFKWFILILDNMLWYIYIYIFWYKILYIKGIAGWGICRPAVADLLIGRSNEE